MIMRPDMKRRHGRVSSFRAVVRRLLNFQGFSGLSQHGSACASCPGVHGVTDSEIRRAVKTLMSTKILRIVDPP
jgi:hypothetical protein